MAEMQIPAESEAVTLAARLTEMAERAEAMEHLIRGASGTLHAIISGAMLAGNDRAAQVAGGQLLDLLQGAITDFEQREGPLEYLSDELRELATDEAEGG